MAKKAINLKNALQEYFGFESFKGNQEAIIKSLLNGQDSLVIMPTGGGKSLCYQLPAIVSEGTAVIVSPLIALMKNQVDLVRNYSSNDNIAHFYNSSLNKTQKKAVRQDVLDGKTKLLYIAPETLNNDETLSFLHGIQVSFVAVDEAHCISEWGHDFRPEYRKIREMISQIGTKIPIIALTATATPKVQSDIIKTLELISPEIFLSSFNRPNLYYEIRPKKNDTAAMKNIVQYIKQQGRKSGIIYVTNRKTTEKVAQMLNVNGILAAPYHAGLDGKVRTRTQDMFLMEEIHVIVATIAFGMGIDKPDVRYIIHFDVPKSLENYYQETGRAGRDGMEGNCICYFAHKDIAKIEQLLKDKSVAEKERAGVLLDETVAYIESAACRRKYILHYFGEEYGREHCDKMCDNCRNPKQKIDVTEDTKLGLKTIVAVKENHHLHHVVKLLLGKKTKEIGDYKHDKLEFFGKGKEKDESYWNAVLRHALIEDLLVKDIENYGLLKLTDKGRKFIQKSYALKVPVNHDYEKEAENDDAIVVASGGGAVLDPALLNGLKDLRKKLAKQHNLPPYVVFQDTSLEEMATRYPMTVEEMGHIFGASKGKLDRYGKVFSEFIKKHVEENNIERPDDLLVKSSAQKGGNKVKIIQMIDKRLPLDDIARQVGIKRADLIGEIESIVNSGTRINIDYHLKNVIDDELKGYIYDYFREHELLDLGAAHQEFESDGLSEEDIKMVHIKFMSDLGN